MTEQHIDLVVVIEVYAIKGVAKGGQFFAVSFFPRDKVEGNDTTGC